MASYQLAAIFILFDLLHILCTQSVNSDYSESWPRFYKMGESTHPTQAILQNLTYYRDQWLLLQHETYSFTMAWDCTPCSLCLRANKFINVDASNISTLAVSSINDETSIAACDASDTVNNNNNNNNNNSNIANDYKTINELYDLVIGWVQNGLQENTEDYLIIELMLHEDYFFPEAVKLSEGSTYIGWDIICYEPGHEEEEQYVCEYTATNKKKKWTFWITREMQSFLGWSMIFLILVACSLGYCINCLKKKKAEKIEAWRAKEEKQRAEEMQKESEIRRQKKDRKREKKRHGSKSKHRSSKGKRKKNRDAIDVEYANVPVILSNVDDGNHSSDSANVGSDPYDIIEEQHPL